MSEHAGRTKMPSIGACWPTAQQELLLGAALLDGEPALKAWQEWQASIDIDDVDHESFRLLPLLYHNLQTLGVQHPWMGRLKGMHRRAWYNNQLLLQPLADVAQRLQSASIPTILLKGAALLLRYYGDFGQRPMGDCDILVPTAQARAAYELMLDSGWTTDLTRDRLTPGYQDYFHACCMFNSAKRSIDLHWHVLHRVYSTAANDEFWQARVPVRLGDVDTSVLGPADQLLHVCMHGTVYHGFQQLRWVADAVAVLRKYPELDWHHLITQAKRHRAALAMRETLGYLQRTLAPQIPAQVLHELQRLPVTWSERQIYRTNTLHRDQRGWLLWAWNYVHPFWQLPLNSAGWRMLKTMVVEYKFHNRLDNVWQVFGHIGWRCVRKITRVFCHRTSQVVAELGTSDESKYNASTH